ncbi:MAG: PSD1 and planctomycete cytochrome C domain-containing protein [Bryobacteraceae bacterium]
MRPLAYPRGTVARGTVVVLAWSAVAVAAPSRFESEVLPALEAACVKCHSGSSAQAGLDVRTFAGLIKGGTSGTSVVAGSPDRSLLLRRIRTGQMPPGGPALDAASIRRIEQWIQDGAPGDSSASEVRDRQHWAFQPPKRPAPPNVKTKGRMRNPIDAFVLAELENRSLTLSPESDRTTLIRRLSFDLVGLPPSPGEVDAFVADRSPDAYEKLVERLLASERYGERWGRHWLDAAGYADSEGVLAADVIRENAWRYRDYVIRAFNQDKPYDRFLLEQFAGDEISDFRRYDKLPAEVHEALAATGFLRTAVDATRDDFLPKDFAEYLWRTVFDTEQIAVSATMGLTIQCARCHDHKYEPIAQKDYYRIQSIFAGALRPTGPVLPTYKRLVVDATKEDQKKAEITNGPLDGVVKALKDLRAARLKQYRARHSKGEKATEAEVRAEFPEFGALAERLDDEIRAEETKRIHLPTIRALYDLDAKPIPTHLLQRGDPLRPGEVVEPGVPAVLAAWSEFSVPSPPADAKTTGRRTAFARWLTRPDHPLTSRVMMNRIWAGHFGAGIVPSLDNFGKSGPAPVNQPLLDWLSTEFVARGWSIKTMHRMIVTSATYRQSSAAIAAALKIDPDNKYLWRMSPRRLEAETIRDAVLAVAGTLDPTMYGEPVAAKTKSSGEVVPEGEECRGRRSVYQLVRRSSMQSFLNAFDAPVMEINCTRRVVSTSATQALALMNSDFITAQAGRFAARVLDEAPPGDSLADPRTVARAFRLALVRPPNAAELQSLETFVRKQSDLYPGAAGRILKYRVYADLCQALLSANEFIYVD